MIDIWKCKLILTDELVLQFGLEKLDKLIKITKKLLQNIFYRSFWDFYLKFDECNRAKRLLRAGRFAKMHNGGMQFQFEIQYILTF